MLRFPLPFLLLGLMLLFPVKLFAQQSQSSADPPTVAELVEQLRSTQREVRESAEKQLIDRGSAILDELPEYDAFKSSEVRSALFRIRRELDDQKIEASLYRTTLTFPDRDLSLAEAVESIREETGNELRLSESLDAPKEPIRFAQEEFTFWEAVNRLIKMYHLDLEVDDTGRGLVFVPGQTRRSYLTGVDVALGHPGRPIAWRLNKVERKPIAGRHDEELIRFEMQLLFEPRLTPLYVKISGNQLADAITEDTDGTAKRETLLPFSPDAVTEIPCHQLPISPAFRVDWMVPVNEQLSKVRFYPKAEVTLAVGRFDFEFKNWEQPRISLRRGMGVVVRDELLVTDDDVSFLLILLFSERGAPFESHREWLTQNLIELKSGEQVLKPSAPPEKELEANGSVAFRYKFDRPLGNPEKWILQYRFPTSFREIEIRGLETIDLAEWLEPKPTEKAP